MSVTIICLKCNADYLEENEQVKICPNCGNDDMMQTIYSCEEENE